MAGTVQRYVLVGFLNTLVGYGAILILEYWLDWGSTAANFGGYAVGMWLSYVLNRSFTFRSQRKHGSAVPAFVLAVGLCYGVNLVVLHAAIALTAVPAMVAQAAAVLAYTLTFYFVSRRIVFTAGESGPPGGS